MSELISRIKQRVAKEWWTLQRFGLSPDKVGYRWANRTEPKLFCVSVPKAGTHLLERLLCLHPRLYRKLVPTINEENLGKWGELSKFLAMLRPGQVIVSHLYFTPERLHLINAKGVKCLVMIRDPRDVVVSQVFYIMKNKKHPYYPLFASQSDVKSRLKIAIGGHALGHFPSIGQRLGSFAGWLESGALVIRFEDLIGAQGNGDKARQLDMLRAIYEFIGIGLAPSQVMAMSARLFSSASPTFHQGAIGRWKEYFDEGTKDFFKQVAGKAIVQYGYEKNDQW